MADLPGAGELSIFCGVVGVALGALGVAGLRSKAEPPLPLSLQPDLVETTLTPVSSWLGWFFEGALGPQLASKLRNLFYVAICGIGALVGLLLVGFGLWLQFA